MKKIFYSLFFSAFIVPLNAQNVFGEPLMVEAFVKSSNINENAKALTEKGYLDDSFYEAMFDGKQKSSQKLRYNAFEDEMEFMNNGKRFFLDKTDNMEIALNDAKKSIYKNFEYKLGAAKYNGYLKQVYKSEEISLFKKESISKDFDKSEDNFNVNSSKIVFKVNKAIYILKNKDGFHQIPKNIKAFSKLVNKPELVNFVNSNNLDISNEFHLKIIMNYLNNKTSDVNLLLESLAG